MGIEEQIDRLIDAGDDILKELETLNERVAEIAKRFAPTVPVLMQSIKGELKPFAESCLEGYESPKIESLVKADGVESSPAEPPPAKPKRWRRVGTKEIVKDGDWMNAMSNSQDKDPPDGGWVPAKAFWVGKEASVDSGLYFAREVTDDADQSDQSPAASEQVEELQPEHSAGPKPDPGDGYRILEKDPPEDLVKGDEYWSSWMTHWESSINSERNWKQDERLWYRRKIEPAKEPEVQSKPWTPKVGDWVLVTKPQDCGKIEGWVEWLDGYDGKVLKVRDQPDGDNFLLDGVYGLEFHPSWLSPAKPPPPPKPEYREPVLPADAGRKCEFSDNNFKWICGWLNGWKLSSRQWVSHSGRDWKHCRIKKDA